MMQNKNSSKGFTLVELLVVIAILATLIALIVPSIGTAKIKANVLACSRNLQAMHGYMFQYKDVYKGYPAGGTVDFWNKMRGAPGADPSPIAQDNRVFYCPVLGVAPDEKNLDHLDYTYPPADPPISDGSNPQRVVSRDKQKNHGSANNINVLFMQGNVETIDKRIPKFNDIVNGSEPYGRTDGDEK